MLNEDIVAGGRYRRRDGVIGTARLATKEEIDEKLADDEFPWMVDFETENKESYTNRGCFIDGKIRNNRDLVERVHEDESPWVEQDVSADEVAITDLEVRASKGRLSVIVNTQGHISMFADGTRGSSFDQSEFETIKQLAKQALDKWKAIKNL